MNRQASHRSGGRHAALRPAGWLALAAAAAALCATSAHAASTVYGVDLTITSATPTGNPLQTDSIVGSITTDGTLGALGGGNILDWNLQLVDHLDASQSFTLTHANSSLVSDGGGALSATAGGLQFDYSGYGEFLIQVSAYSGSQYFCLSTGVYACARGETISPGYVFSDGVELVGSAAPVGTQPLSAVPEPATTAMLAAGLLAVGMRRRRQGR